MAGRSQQGYVVAIFNADRGLWITGFSLSAA